MAKMHKIRHLRRKCISCGACAFHAPQTWKMNDVDGLSDAQGGVETKNGEVYADLHEEDLADNQRAAENCPVKIIHIDE